MSSILDGLRPDQKRIIRAGIDAVVARYPDIPEIREELMRPDGRLSSAADPFLAAVMQVAFVDGWYAHRQHVLEEITARRSNQNDKELTIMPDPIPDPIAQQAQRLAAGAGADGDWEARKAAAFRPQKPRDEGHADVNWGPDPHPTADERKPA